MKKRTTVKIIAFACAISVLGFGYFIKERQNTKRYKLYIENEYAKSLNSLTSSLNNITETLNKAVYLKNGQDLAKMSARLYAEGELAKDSLGNLPNGSKNSGTLYKFLSQVGNYAMSISESTAEDGQIKPEETQKLLNLLDTSKKISKAVATTNVSYENLEDFAVLLDEKIDKSVDIKTLATSLDDLEEDLSDYPTLIYDGPFSDHILSKEPLMISGKKVFSKAECKKKAEKVFGVNDGSLKYDGMQDGKIKCYRFKNDNMTVCLSKSGGYIVYMRKNRSVSGSKLSNKTAADYAKEFMRNLGVTNMVETYSFSDEGVCVTNFAYLDGQTFCYTDLIKVGVALDTGEIMLFESGGYLTNHTERAFETPKYSLEEAKKTVSDLLTVKSSLIALIPTDSGGEVRCYEFLCENESKQELLVYVGVKDLKTKNIFILEKSDAGTVVR